MGFESINKEAEENKEENHNDIIDINTKESLETMDKDEEKVSIGVSEDESVAEEIVLPKAVDEKIPEKKEEIEIESKSEFQFTCIDDDPRFKELQEELNDEAIKDHLDRIKKSYGISDFEARLKLKDSSLGVRQGIDGKLRQAFYPIAFHREFEKRYPEDYAKYQESERTRVYDTWFDDPAVSKLKNSISDLDDRYKKWDVGHEYRAYTSQQDVETHLAEERDAFRKFAQDFPEKAAVYRKFYKELDNNMNWDEVSQRVAEDKRKFDKDLADEMNRRWAARKEAEHQREFYIDMDNKITWYEAALKPTYKKVSPEQLEDEMELTSIISSSEKMDISSLPDNQGTILPIEANGSSEGSVEEDRAEFINQAFKSDELTRSHILEHDLAYQDAELPEQTKDAMLEWSKASSSASKYAESLEQMAETESLERLRQQADIIKRKMITNAERIGLPLSKHGMSRSWAMWDLGKQFYYFLHPEQSGVKYEIANPLSSEKKQQEIIDRHLGWEAYAAFNSNSPESVEWRNTIIANPKFTKALEILNKKPKENKTLSSFDLTALGTLLRKA